MLVTESFGSDWWWVFRSFCRLRSPCWLHLCWLHLTGIDPESIMTIDTQYLRILRYFISISSPKLYSQPPTIELQHLCNWLICKLSPTVSSVFWLDRCSTSVQIKSITYLEMDSGHFGYIFFFFAVLLGREFNGCDLCSRVFFFAICSWLKIWCLEVLFIPYQDTAIPTWRVLTSAATSLASWIFGNCSFGRK